MLDRYAEDRAANDTRFRQIRDSFMRTMLNAADRAMADEGIDEDTRHRVLNRLLLGRPEQAKENNPERDAQ